MKKLALTVLCLSLACCGKSLDKQVRDQVRSFDSARLGKKKVKVVKVRQVGKEAVAEVEIQAAVKMTRVKGEWVIGEVRLGDRRWIPAARLLKVAEAAWDKATRSELKEISGAIGRFAADEGRVPQVSRFEPLIDLLAPRYLERVVRLDGWSHPFLYSALGEKSYELRSRGPDGRAYTQDDLVVRDTVQ